MLDHLSVHTLSSISVWIRSASYWTRFSSFTLFTHLLSLAPSLWISVFFYLVKRKIINDSPGFSQTPLFKEIQELLSRLSFFPSWNYNKHFSPRHNNATHSNVVLFIDFSTQYLASAQKIRSNTDPIGIQARNQTRSN